MNTSICIFRLLQLAKRFYPLIKRLRLAFVTLFLTLLLASQLDTTFAGECTTTVGHCTAALATFVG